MRTVHHAVIPSVARSLGGRECAVPPYPQVPRYARDDKSSCRIDFAPETRREFERSDDNARRFAGDAARVAARFPVGPRGDRDVASLDAALERRLDGEAACRGATRVT